LQYWERAFRLAASSQPPRMKNTLNQAKRLTSMRYHFDIAVLSCAFRGASNTQNFRMAAGKSFRTALGVRLAKK